MVATQSGGILFLLLTSFAAALLLGAAVPANASLNVWLERRTLARVFDWMHFMAAKNPLRGAKCKASAKTVPHSAMTSKQYPLISEGLLLSNPQVDTLSKAGIALAHNINSLTINWSAADYSPESQVRYRFLRLKSHNITVLREPTVDIPMQGYVPNARSGFQLRLQCSNRISGITGFEIHVVFDWPQHPMKRLIVLQRHFKKACLSEDDLARYQRKCYCRSLCTMRRRSKKVKLRHAFRARRASQQRRRCHRRCQRRCRKSPSSCAGLSSSNNKYIKA